MTVQNLDLAALSDLLDRLCPMHMILRRDGRILHAGPTLAKIAGAPPLTGRDLFEVFDLRTAMGAASLAGLIEAAGRKVQLQLRAAPGTSFKGVVAPLARGDAVVVNLALGIAAPETVGHHALTLADFAPTDLTVEMLYLLEAKSAAMRESRALNMRLEGAMLAAEEKAFTDTLTGLKNRRALDFVLGRMIGNLHDFSVMQIDLDLFKAVNDSAGHAAGDHVLVCVADVLRTATRGEDLAARTGGDEFTLLFDRLVQPDRLEDVALRIISGIEAPIPYAGGLLRVSASAGTAISTDYAHPAATRMLADADRALYASKRAGKARHTIWNPLRNAPAARQHGRGR